MEEKTNRVLIDSNIIIYSAQPGFGYLREWLRNKEVAVSKISKIEVLGYHKLLKNEETYFKRFFESSINYSINNSVIQTTIKLRQYKKMSLGDSIIAATAIRYDLPLMTANDQDFENLEQLKLITLNAIH
jgi:predicted nucleic acid-binding protein